MDVDAKVKEEQLVTASRKGDLGAFEQLMHCHQGWVRAFFRSRISDWTAAEDLAQEVFVTAFRRLSKYRGDSNFEAFLRGIAQNYFRNYIRKMRETCVGGQDELQLLLTTSVADWEVVSRGSERLDALGECLGELDGPAKEMLLARYTEGRSVKELSEETGRGYSALTMQLHRLREVLARCVETKLAGEAI